MGSATGLRTVDTACIRNALLKATKTGTSVQEYLRDEEIYSKQYNETEQFLRPAESL